MLLCTRAAGATSSSAADATYSEQPLARFRFDVAHERQRKKAIRDIALASTTSTPSEENFPTTPRDAGSRPPERL